METKKETYYLVEYHDVWGGKDNEGVFTKKSWEKYIKELNEERKQDDEILFDERMEKNIEFVFTEIKVYI